MYLAVTATTIKAWRQGGGFVKAYAMFTRSSKCPSNF